MGTNPGEPPLYADPRRQLACSDTLRTRPKAPDIILSSLSDLRFGEPDSGRKHDLGRCCDHDFSIISQMKELRLLEAKKLTQTSQQARGGATLASQPVLQQPLT